MKMFNKKTCILISWLLVISFCLCSCRVKIPLNYEDIHTMTYLQVQEDYKNEIKVKRAKEREKRINLIDLHSVSPEINQILQTKVYNDIEELNQLESNKNKRLINYFKLLLDNRVVINNLRYKVYTNNKRYYVFVGFDTEKNPQVNELKKVASYIGIKGAIGYNQYDEEAVDVEYLKMLVKEINNQRLINNQDPIDEEIEQINYQDEVDLELEIYGDQVFLNKIGTLSEIITKDETENYLYLASKSNLFNEIQDDIKIEAASLDSFGRKIRTLIYDAEEFNSNLGLVSDSEYLLPSIKAAFKIPYIDKALTGYSLYNWGETINEVKNTKKAYEFMFIYDYNMKSNDYDLVNIVPYRIYTGNFNENLSVEDKVNTTIKYKEDNIYYDSFIIRELERRLEDYHRAFCDKSFNSFTSQNIILPQDLGLYFLYYRDCISLFDSDMYLDSIIRKEGETYLTKVFQVCQENIDLNRESNGQYYKEWLIRFRIVNGELYIDDMYLDKLECLRVPENKQIPTKMYKLESNKEILKEVDDKTIEDITQNCLRKLESAVTYSIKTDNLDLKGNVIYAEKDGIKIPGYGIVSRFNSDSSILKSNLKEKYLNDISNRINKYGKLNKPKLYITANKSSWLQKSADNSLVMAKLDFYYIYKDIAEISTYYITFSNYNNTWVIDEMDIVEDSKGQTIIYNNNKDIINSWIEQFEKNRNLVGNK